MAHHGRFEYSRIWRFTSARWPPESPSAALCCRCVVCTHYIREESFLLYCYWAVLVGDDMEVVSSSGFSS